ncbi:Olfactory receptor 14J1-like protein [Aix galericulata]|nr:Olfactory receptor 14J1-like protein [Aix galericulata]
MPNSSFPNEFLLLPFTDTRELQLLYFGLFLGIYLAALLGNGLILTAIACDHRLHTPMYFFLLNLALLDLGSISTTVPKAMANSLWDTRAISYQGCAAQVLFSVFFIGAEYSLLTIMAYDRYVAICKPLHYGSLLGSRACAQMAAAAWGSGFLNAVLHTANTFSLPLCQGNAVDQFFCEIPQILKLSCSDAYLKEIGALDPMRNSSSVSKFLLLAFADTRELQLLHFTLFLCIYLAALLGNGLILTAVACHHRLHTPMYFFLLNLALLDLGSISTTLPKAMANSLWDTRAISYQGCATQVFCLFFLLGAENSLLTVMAYDRYVAICKPLHYGSLLGSRACAQMAAAAWGSGFLDAVLHTANTFSLPLCHGNAVDQFFCEVPQILKLSCSDAYLREIFRAVLRMPSEQGRHKAFSTCLPHLAVIFLFVSTGLFAYLKPPYISFPSLDLVVSFLYSVVPPAVNPLIYSMRNQELKNAIRKLFEYMLLKQGIGHSFRDSGRDAAQVKEGEVEEEEVHGGVKMVVADYSGEDEAVAQEGSQVDAQEEPEVEELQLPSTRATQCIPAAPESLPVTPSFL